MRAADRPASPRMDQAGFTLVEMLVALGVFALLGLAAVALLRTSVSAQGRVTARLDDAARWSRTHAIVTRDLAHLLPAPAPVGDGRSLTLWVADGAALEPPRRVTYRAGVDALLARDAGGGAARLLPGAGMATLRYRSADGAWHDRWPPVGGAQANGGPAVPVAVEWTLIPAGGATVTMVVPTGPVPPAGPGA